VLNFPLGKVFNFVESFPAVCRSALPLGLPRTAIVPKQKSVIFIFVVTRLQRLERRNFKFRGAGVKLCQTFQLRFYASFEIEIAHYWAILKFNFIFVKRSDKKSILHWYNAYLRCPVNRNIIDFVSFYQYFVPIGICYKVI